METPARTPQITARLVVIPLVDVFVSARSRLLERRVILIEAGATGMSGWGEAAPVPGHSNQTVEELWARLEAEGRAAFEPETGLLRAAYAGAIDDLEARCAGRPLWSELGDASPVWASAAIGVVENGEPDRRLLETAAASGYRFAKLKITQATSPAHVAAAIAAHPTIRFGADANGTLGTDEHVLSALDELGLAYIEQPGPAQDLDFHSRIRTMLETPISLDESAATPGSIARIIAAGAADIVNLKVGRFGPARTLQLATELRQAGLGARLGGLIETGIGRAHTVALAAHGPFAVVGDIAASDRYFADDLVRPQWRLDHGELPLPGWSRHRCHCRQRGGCITHGRHAATCPDPGDIRLPYGPCRNLCASSCSACFSVSCLTAPAAAQTTTTVAEPTNCGTYEGVVCMGWFSDNADIATQDAAIEEAIGAVVEHYGHQIAIVTVDKSPHGSPLEFAQDLGNAWGVGDATRQDGIVILDRRRQPAH